MNNIMFDIYENAYIMNYIFLFLLIFIKLINHEYDVSTFNNKKLSARSCC